MNRSIVQSAVLGFFIMALALLPSPARATDGDQDGIPDALELALAQRFFPTLNLHCGSYEGLAYGDRRQLYGHLVSGYPNSSNGKIPFVAHPYPGNGSDCAEPFQCIEIRYGIAWNWDLGDDAFGGGHRGDSEMYAILVARKDTDGTGQWGTTWTVAQNDANQWRLMKEFMSAHLNTEGDSSSYRGHGKAGATTYQRIWAAEGKHALYPTQSACNNGNAADIDDCSDNRCEIRADVYTDVQNIGEELFPLNRYIPYPASSKTTSPSGTYDVWSGLKFGDSGDYRSRLKRPLSWCTASLYCVPDCLLRDPQCAAGDVEAGDCSGECGVRPADGILCQAVRCY